MKALFPDWNISDLWCLKSSAIVCYTALAFWTWQLSSTYSVNNANFYTDFYTDQVKTGPVLLIIIPIIVTYKEGVTEWWTQPHSLHFTLFIQLLDVLTHLAAAFQLPTSNTQQQPQGRSYEGEVWELMKVQSLCYHAPPQMAYVG